MKMRTTKANRFGYVSEKTGDFQPKAVVWPAWFGKFAHGRILGGDFVVLTIAILQQGFIQEPYQNARAKNFQVAVRIGAKNKLAFRKPDAEIFAQLKEMIG